MAVTVSSIITNFNSYIGDSSTDRISSAERIQYITEATIWLQEELQNDTQTCTHTLDYFDTVHTYKTSSSIGDLLEGADLRRAEGDQNYTFAHKGSRELAEDIGQSSDESAWAIERRDGDTYLVINHNSKYASKTIADCDSLTSGGGTWSLDTVNSDAVNLTIDNNEYKTGAGSFNFDADVSQSGNNKITIKNTTLSTLDLTQYENLSSFLLWVYVPDSTFFSSVTLYWGSSSSDYWSATATTDIGGAAFVTGWNRVKIEWLPTISPTGSPDKTSVVYMQVDLNYTASQGDLTDWRVNGITICRPEKLTFYYLSWNIGKTSGGTDLSVFTATTDVPFFSGQYDQYKFAVAHKAASLCFQNLRLVNESQDEQREAERILDRAKTLIPSTKTTETKNFKVRGVNLTRTNRRRN